MTYLIQTRPDVGKIARWGHARDFVIGDDLGYAMHALLSAAFSNLAPKPFVLKEEVGGHRKPYLLAYSSRPASELAKAAASFGEPEALECLGLEDMASKKMPVFEKGDRLGVEFVTRPTVRTRTRNSDGRTTEHDIFVYAAMQAAQDVALNRDEVYLAWGHEKLAAAGAHANSLRVVSRMMVPSARRSRSGERTRLKPVTSAEVRFAGTVEVTDVGRFNEALASGIGRHRAFGMGMLVLRPPRD